MFETIDRVQGRERCVRRVREIVAQQARLAQELMLLVREAEDGGYCEQDGCTSSAAWLALVSSSDYRTAARITRTNTALRELPALDRALETGELTLDQGAAAAEFAAPA